MVIGPIAITTSRTTPGLRGTRKRRSKAQRYNEDENWECVPHTARVWQRLIKKSFEGPAKLSEKPRADGADYATLPTGRSRATARTAHRIDGGRLLHDLNGTCRR